MLETAYQYRGFSWQREMHWKTVDDTESGEVVDMKGLYAQAGYFVHVLFPAFPKPLEIALRWAEVDPDTAVAGDLEQETTMVANWFFSGHRNKLTFDFSRLRTMANQSGRRWANRIRLQWDVSF